MNLQRLGAIVVKELRQLRRDRLTFAMIVGIPVMQLVLFGFAINMDVRNLNAAVLDQAQTAHSREVIAELGSSQVLNIKYQLSEPQQITSLLREGRISAALVIPPDFETRLQRKDSAPLQLIVDGSDQVVQSAARQLANYPLPGWTQPPPITLANFYNPERLAPLNTVPALIGVILAMTMVLFTAIALVRERERGNMEMLITTPVSPWELSIGKVLPFVGIGMVQVTVILIVGYLLFGVPVRGSILELYCACLIYIIASLTLGIMISTMAQSQFQAMQLAFFTFLPQILLSGFMFPFAGMPEAAQWFAEILPLTHFVRLARGIMLRGASLHELWLEMVVLGLFTVVMMSIAVARVHKRLD